MKKLKVTIELEMSVPDDWQLVATSEDSPVLQLPNGVFMDIAIEPLFASNPEEIWSSTTTRTRSTPFWTWSTARP